LAQARALAVAFVREQARGLALERARTVALAEPW
jgi:hypothetical protein